MLQKYLKYKQKYLNLKKIIGGGIEAVCHIDDDDGFNEFNTLNITYGENNIQYTNISNSAIGEGSYGKVYKIKKINSTDNTEYVFKMSLNKKMFKKMLKKTPIIKEGEYSSLLEGLNILDNESLVLFQGFILDDFNNQVGEFLISTFNGVDLRKKYTSTNNEDHIETLFDEQPLDEIHNFTADIKKEQFFSILQKILEHIKKLNNKKFYHNDIKLDNIVIDDNNEVRLIDFGTLDKTSRQGTFVSMSYKTLLSSDYIKDKKYDIIGYLNNILIDTDIFGFFYCCIDLLFLLNDENTGSVAKIVFENFGILSGHSSFIKLFNLYYLILPEENKSYKFEEEVKELTINDPTLVDENKDILSIFDKILPTRDITYNFCGCNDKNINLYRYILFIYNILIDKGIGLIVGNDNLKHFLLGISVCLLPSFDYNNFNFDELSKLI